MTRKSKIKIMHNRGSSFLVHHTLSALILALAVAVIAPVFMATIEKAQNIVPTDMFEEK